MKLSKEQKKILIKACNRSSPSKVRKQIKNAFGSGFEEYTTEKLKKKFDLITDWIKWLEMHRLQSTFAIHRGTPGNPRSMDYYTKHYNNTQRPEPLWSKELPSWTYREEGVNVWDGSPFRKPYKGAHPDWGFHRGAVEGEPPVFGYL